MSGDDDAETDRRETLCRFVRPTGTAIFGHEHYPTCCAASPTTVFAVATLIYHTGVISGIDESHVLHQRFVPCLRHDSNQDPNDTEFIKHRIALLPAGFSYVYFDEECHSD